MRFNDLRRRDFIRILGGSAVVWPLAARAQQAERVRRIAILMPFLENDTEIQARVRAFREELGKLGWSEGRNVQFDERWTTDNMDLVRANAANLLEGKPDVIVAIGGRVIPVLAQMTRSVPIIVPGGADPLRTGWVGSLARPGGNITGFSTFELSVIGKILETLKEIAPRIVRIAAIYNPDNPNATLFVRAFEDFAGPLAFNPIISPIHGLADIARAIDALAKQQDGGIFFPTDITTTALRDQIVALVARRRLPAIYSERVFVTNGGLAFYGADRIDLHRRAASYVDRILRGEKAGDLPYQQPTKYELVINLKTAKALGLDVPPILLARADEVIE